VYAYLRDKDTPSGKAGSPYYVGVAGSVARPYQQHRRTPVPQDERRIRMLRSNVTHEQAREWEKFYIEKYGRKDAGTGRKMLLNRTDGGDGIANLSSRTRAKIGAASKGRTPSAEARAKMSAAHQGKSKGAHSAEARAKMSAARQGKTLSAEHRAKISAASKGRAFSDEHRANIGAASKNRTHSAEARAKMSAAARNRSVETLAKISAAQKVKTIEAANKYGIALADYEKLSRTQRGHLGKLAKNGRTAQEVLAMWRAKGKL
jgi:hypothetical protein